MIKILLMTLILLLGFGSSSPQAAKEGKNFFEKIRFTETSDTLVVKFDFASGRKLKHKIKFFEGFIQLELSPAFIEVKQALYADSELLDNIQVYAYKPGVLRVRLFFKVDGQKFLDKFKLRREGRRLVLYLEKEARNMERGLERKIVKELDREILTALSGGLNEEGGTPESLPEPELEPGDGGVRAGALTDLSLPEADPKVGEDEAEVLNIPVAHDSFNWGGVDTAPAETTTGEKKSTVGVEKTSAETEVTVPTGTSREAAKAGKAVKTGTQVKPAPVDYGVATLLPDFFKMVGALGIVLALIFFATAGAKKLLSQNSSLLGGGRLVRVISSTPIGVKKQITLVEVAGEVLVLGVSGESISMLMKLAPEDAATLLTNVKEGDKSRGSGRILKKKKREKRSFDVEVEDAVKTQEVSQREEMINDVAKSIREKIEVIKRA